MKCRKVKESVVLYLYDDLSSAERTAFEEHVRTCPGCGRELEESRRIFSVLRQTGKESAPQVSWEKSWARIDARLGKKERRPFGFFPSRGWAIAAAFLLCVFMLGVGIGRLLFPPSGAAAAQTGARSGSLQAALREHLENLKPMVVEYANYSKDRNGGDPVPIDKDLLRALIAQNQLLKQIIAEHDPAAAPLLEDLDLVLKEIAVQKSREENDSDLVKNIIERRDVILKMELFKTI